MSQGLLLVARMQFAPKVSLIECFKACRTRGLTAPNKLIDIEWSDKPRCLRWEAIAMTAFSFPITQPGSRKTRLRAVAT